MAPLVEYRMLIGGKWVAAADGRHLETENPFTRSPWARIPRGGSADAAAAVTAAHDAFEHGPWPAMSASDRGVLLFRLADLVAREAESLAATEVRDNGKRITEMMGQLRRIPDWYRYFGGLADKIEGRVPPHNNPDILNINQYEPLGVVAAFTPWNSPLLLAAYKLAPLLAAGNTVVLKPSEYTSASSLEFARLAAEAGFPPGVINVVTGYGREIGPSLVSDPRVAKISLTGGEEAGRTVYKLAAESFQHVALELGGKSPNIVFEDCNLENAVNGVMAGIFAATGQTCIAGSRLLVQDTIHDRFLEKLIPRATGLRMGDPADPATQIAPIATEPQFQKILEYIDIAKREGANVALGGKVSSGPGCGNGLFIEPTVLTEVTNDMRIAREEVFGPVLAVIRFKDEAEAIEIANDTPYGLAAGLWTSDMPRAIRASKRLRAGTVWVNTYRAVSYLSPFGGYKQSGIGRENGIEAIKEYLQIKSIWFNSAEHVANPFGA